MSDTVSFTEMKHGTKAEYEMLHEMEQAYIAGTANRILKELASQAEDSISGYQVNRLEHALQGATRAFNEDAEVDWIVGTLLHDIGDGLSPRNHDRFAAEIIRPFVREEVSWVVEVHASFQMFYYAHHYGCNQFEREKHKDSPYYQSAIDFCERWDQNCFDPNYQYKSLEFFRPMVEAVFARKPYDENVLQPGVVKGIPVLTAN